MISNNNSTIDPPRKFHEEPIQNRSLVDLNLNQAIKKNNVRHYINKGLTQLNENIKIDSQRFSGLEDHLLQLKKSVSQLTRQIKNKESQSLKYRDQTLYANQKIKKLKNQRSKVEEKISQLQKNLQKVNTKRQAALHCSKTYEHMLERMKKDNILQQFSKNELQRQLKGLLKTRDMTKTKHYSISQLQKLSVIGVKDAQQQLQKQQALRKNNLSIANKQSLRKITKENKLKQSQNQSDQIHQMGACDIQDADLMRLKKFLTVQILLRQFLKSKMSKLKKYYDPYEQAFFEIKSKTNVRDSSSLKYQFFNFQNTYNQKTSWVKVLQQQIAEAQKQNRELKEKLAGQRIFEMQLIESLESRQQEVSSANIRQLNQKSLQQQMLWQRIQSWIKVYGKKIKIHPIQQSAEKNFHAIIQRIEESQKLQTLQKDDSKIETNCSPAKTQLSNQII